MSVTAQNYLESEIREQKTLIQEFFQDQERLQSIGVNGLNLGKVSHIQIIACGSSYNAGLLGLQYLEVASNIPVSIVYGSEFVFSESPSHTKTLYIVISQSGETKDILDSVEILDSKNCQVIGITNERNSSLAKNISTCHFLDCGKEKSVAATKTFTMTCLYLYVFSLALGKNRGFIKTNKFQQKVQDIGIFINSLEAIFSNTSNHTELIPELSKFDSVLCLGNGVDYPVALECSLKLREISLLHVEGMPTGELKHGPIAMLDSSVFVVAIVTRENYLKRQKYLFERIVSSGAKLAIMTTIKGVEQEGAEVIVIEKTEESFNPLLLNVFGQLLALNLGTSLKRNVDKPRNLTKVMSL